MNMAIIAASPKPWRAPVFSAVFFSAVSGLSCFRLCLPPILPRYILLKKMERIMPHIMQILMSSAMVAKAVGVICAAERAVIPTCSAAPCATWVS